MGYEHFAFEGIYILDIILFPIEVIVVALMRYKLKGAKIPIL